MKKTISFTILPFLFFALSLKSFSQTLPVGSPVLEDYYRRMQLVGRTDSLLSFAIRPLTASALKSNDIFSPDPEKELSRWNTLQSISFLKGKGEFELLPIVWQQQYNSNHPYGWNDGAMIPARGYQTLFSAGFFAKLGPISIQLKPEYVYASNKGFISFSEGRSDNDLYNYYFNYNYIDAPERFGASSYRKLLWGQSSIRLNVGPASLGISNENIWWGPGIRNSIIMSNNAAGFKHITLNTIKPITTYIGSFEAQIIAGRLEGSDISPLLQETNSMGEKLYLPKSKDWRYLSALNISYQPKWITGLFFGFTRSFMAYHGALQSVSDYFPLFIPFQKVKINSSLGETTDRDQRTSLYTRWVFQKAKAELYFEYGLNDNAYNLRDFFGSPQHARAYLFGLIKVVPLTKKGQYIKVATEVTQLSQTVDYLTRNARSFYYHDPIVHGYTNEGEVIGAGIGTGGNLQSLDVSWVNELKQIGITVERYEHNMDFAQEAQYLSLNNLSRRWVDLAFAANGTWNYKNLLFNAKFQGIKSLNYQWVLKNYTPDQYYIPNNDVFNFHGELGVTYRF